MMKGGIRSGCCCPQSIRVIWLLSLDWQRNVCSNKTHFIGSIHSVETWFEWAVNCWWKLVFLNRKVRHFRIALVHFYVHVYSWTGSITGCAWFVLGCFNVFLFFFTRWSTLSNCKNPQRASPLWHFARAFAVVPLVAHSASAPDMCILACFVAFSPPPPMKRILRRPDEDHFSRVVPMLHSIQFLNNGKGESYLQLTNKYLSPLISIRLMSYCCLDLGAK